MIDWLLIMVPVQFGVSSPWVIDIVFSKLFGVSTAWKHPHADCTHPWTFWVPIASYYLRARLIFPCKVSYMLKMYHFQCYELETTPCFTVVREQCAYVAPLPRRALHHSYICRILASLCTTQVRGVLPAKPEVVSHCHRHLDVTYVSVVLCAKLELPCTDRNWMEAFSLLVIS